MKYRSSIHCLVSLTDAFLALGLLCGMSVATLAGPDIKGFHSPTDIFDNGSSMPFQNVQVTDTEGAALTVSITVSPSGYGTFQTSSGLDANYTYRTVLSSAAGAETILRSLVFVPQLGKIPVGGSQVVTFTVSATDTNGASSAPDSSTALKIYGPGRPVIGGAGDTRTITDKQTWSPFSSVTVQDGYSATVSMTIVASPAGYGAFQSASGLTVSGNVATITPRTAAQAQTLMRSLVFDPWENHIPIGSSQNVTFTIWATDTNGLCSFTNSATVLTVTPVNDAPTLSGVASVSTTDKVSVSPFSNVAIADVDNDGAQEVTVSVTQSDLKKGTLLLNSSGFTRSGATSSFTGTPASAQAAIRQLSFAPAENHIPVGQTETTTFSITVTDAAGASDAGSSSVTATSVNDPPTLTGLSSAHQSVATGRSINPFAGAFLVDPDVNTDTNRVGQSQTITVTMSGVAGNGQLQYSGFSGTVFTQSGLTPVDATTILRGLVFTAQTFPLTNTNSITFTVVLSDDTGAAVTNSSVVVDVSTPYVPPGLSGTRADQRVNDNSTIALFSTVTVQSFNGGFFQVIVRLDSDAKGELINLGGFVKSGAPASYVFTGPSEDATTALRQMLFQPVNNRLNGASNETVVVSLTLIDGAVTNAPDLNTSVIVTPVNDAPTIQGISPLATITDAEQRAPFSTVLLSDVDELAKQLLSVSVRLDDNAKGGFSSASLAESGFVTSSGLYTFAGTPTVASAAIRKLVFVPTAHRLPVGLSDITTFTVTVNDNHGGLVANNATQVRVAAVNAAPVISVPSSPVSLPLVPPINPLASVSFSSPQAISVTLGLTNSSWGTFTDASLAANSFSNNAPGFWVFTGSASNATVAVAGLEFVPDGLLPIGTTITFLISAQDESGNIGQAALFLVLRQNQRSLIVTKLTDFDPTDASVPASEKNGTLRQAVKDAGNNDHITFDIRSGAPGVPDYPAVLRLRSTIVLKKNVTFDGPGAERMTISGDSNGDGVPDVQLFEAGARVVMNRLALAKGFHPTAGGAVGVAEGASLALRGCAVTDCSAGVWGGGIDVFLGSLEVDHCLFRGNSTRSSTGQGGGAISVYSFLPARIANTTFSANQQLSPAGLGGGALYLENADPGVEMDVDVVSCTFSANTDAASHGTSIRPNVFNTVVFLQNCILADGQGKNLEMDESGMIVSLGGNISDDATATIFSMGGDPYNIVILDQLTDALSTNANLLPLANNGGATWTYGLGSPSLAQGKAVVDASYPAGFGALATDQRGYLRDSAPDTGAFERQAGARVVIEEILCAPALPNNEFIEFYVPRDSTSLNLSNCQVWVGGVLRHTFASQNLRPGEALVLFSHDATDIAVPTGVYRQIAAGNLSLDNMADTITLKNPAGQVLLEVSYVNAFSCSDPADAGYLAAANQSLVLSPQFQGVYLPYQRVVAKEGGRVPASGELAGAGYDAGGAPLTVGNAPPLAYNDTVATEARTCLTAIPVLENDVDPDATDTIRVVAAGSNGVLGDTGASFYQAGLLIHHSPRTGASITYCPSSSAFLRSLPQGSNVVDTFQYVILDSSNAVDHVRGSTPEEIARNLAKATATVTVTVTGVNQAPTPADDSVATYSGLTTREDAVLDFTTAGTLLANDTDPNTDDDSTTLKVISVQATNGCANTTQTLSALGAAVTLDIRYNRNETHITYDPRGSAVLNAIPAGQSRVDTFYYSVADRYGAVGTAAVRITVTGVNDAPTANPDTAATDEDTPMNLPAASLLANDTDPDEGTALQIVSAGPVSARGAAVSVAGGHVLYDPTVSGELNALARDEVVSDRFAYVIADGSGGTNSASVTMTITGVNDAPWLTNDLYATGEKIPVSIAAPGVLVNDRDPDVNGRAPDDTVRVLPTVGQHSGLGARVSMNIDGSFSYDPTGALDWLAQGWTTNDTFTYTVMDHSLTFANADLFTVRSGSSGNLLPVLANDACLSAAGGALTVTAVGVPDQGGLAVVSNAVTIVYTPPLNFSGVETFTYSVADGLGGSDSTTVAVTVTSTTLSVNPDSFTVAKGSAVGLNVVANDAVTPLGALLSVVGVSAGDKGGTITLSGSGAGAQVSYTPAAGNTCPFTETFTYTAAAAGQQATGVVSVTVIDRSNTLTVNDDNFTVSAGGVNLLDVLANDAVLPATNAAFIITSIQTNGVMGTVSINAAGTRLVYRPAPGVVQEPLIYYTVSDGAGGTATANVLIRVQDSGIAGNDDVFSVMKNSANNALPVLLNDSAFPAANLTITAIGLGGDAPNHGGSVTVNSAGTGLIYTPAPDFAGEESFTYELGDGSPARGQAHVRIKVLDLASVVSNPDAFAVARNSANNSLNVLSNDYVLPRTAGRLTVTGVQTNGAFGSITRSGSGANNLLVYTPAADFIGTDTFYYVVADEFGNASTNAVAVRVGELLTRPDQFTAVSDSVQLPLDVLANDLAFPDVGTVRPLVAVGTPDHGGTAALNGDATMVLYTPPYGFVGIEQFSYQVADDSGRLVAGNALVRVLRAGSDRTTATVTMTVIGTNDLPVVAGTHASQITERETVHPFSGVLIADVDEFGLQLQTVTVTLDNPAKGSLCNAGGFVTAVPGTCVMRGTPAAITAALRGMVYVPVQHRITVTTPEPATFTVSVDDGFAPPVLDSATVVTVSAVNTAPAISGTLGGQRVSAHLTCRPFQAVTITEIDELAREPLAVTVRLDAAAHGYFTNLCGFVPQAPGVYALNPTIAADATAALRNLVFVPTVGDRLGTNAFEVTRMTLGVTDSGGASVEDANTTVLACNDLVGKVSANNGSVTNLFACSVSVSPGWLLVGAPTATGNYYHSGSAWLYACGAAPGEWAFLKKLTSADTGTVFSQYDQFGASVSVEGDVVAVGAPGAFHNTISSGVIYLFGRDQGGAGNWGQVKKVLPPDGSAGDLFGVAVAVYGDTLVAGARANKTGDVKTGAAYVFERNQGGANTWGMVKKLTPPDGAEGDDFGVSVAIDQDTIAVGARNQFAGKFGAVYVFERNLGGANAWGLSRKVSVPDVSANAGFGQSVALRGGLLAVGAPADTVGSLKAGSAYVFARNQGGSNQWGPLAKLTALDGQADAGFGSSVSLDNGFVGVGAKGAAGSGAVYVFAKAQPGVPAWGLAVKMTPPPADGADGFGAAVSLRQNTLVAGSRTYTGLNQQVLTYSYRLKFGNAPVFLDPVLGAQLTLNQPFEFVLPSGSVMDPDAGDVPAVTLGSALPSWLNFAAGRFFGTPSVPGVYTVNLLATDSDGYTDSAQVVFTVVPRAGELSLAGVSSHEGAFTLQVAGLPGLTYVVERAESLAGPAPRWTEIGTLTTDASGLASLAEPKVFSTVFYRLKLR